MSNVKSAVYVALISNIITFLVKLFASIMTGSIAMLAETLRSFSDIMNQVFLAIGINLSSQKPSINILLGEERKFSFGHL
jgi:divalent metal cation (Fe/Co/Zn/Cd) transporter